ncbi:MAG: hypothetical protein EVA65_08055 [Oceanococcus sp.]|nr:MAG: hypothetical protein EVA65_08055 [Oceanococcus sp.]
MNWTSEMSLRLDPAATIVLHLMLARGMLIGDRIKLSILNVSWEESGRSKHELNLAIAQLQRHQLVRVHLNTPSTMLELTPSGVEVGHQKPAPAPAAQPKPRSSKPRVRRAPPMAQRAASQAADSSSAPPARSLEHASVFRSRDAELTPRVMQLSILGLTHHYRLAAGGSLPFETIRAHWFEMGLSEPDLLYALDGLINSGDIQTRSQPRELIILTARGQQRYQSLAADLDEGLDRWRAKKLLRRTKNLGALPAACA